MKHVMVDLETLGVSPDAVILQLGAVVFCEGPNGKPAVSQGFNQYVSAGRQSGRTVDGGTLDFWLNADEGARKLVGRGTRSLGDVLSVFCQWLIRLTDDDPRELALWANPAHFDVAILHHAYRSYGMEVPWHHRQVFCARPIVHLAGRAVEERMAACADYRVKGTVKHDACDDAYVQAHELVHAYVSRRGTGLFNDAWKRT